VSFFTKKRKQKTDLSGQSGAFAGLGHGRTLGEVGRATGGSVDREAHRALGLVDKKIISIVSVQTVFSIRRTDLAHQVRALAQLLEEAALGRVDHKRTRSGRSVGLQTKKQLQFCSGVFFFSHLLVRTLPARPGHLEKSTGHFSAMGGQRPILDHMGQVAALVSTGHLRALAPACGRTKKKQTNNQNQSESVEWPRRGTFPANPGHLAALARAGHL